MLSNKDTAHEIDDMMSRCSAILNDSIRRVMQTCSEDEFKAYRPLQWTAGERVGL